MRIRLILSLLIAITCFSSLAGSICAEETADTTQTSTPESTPATVDDLVAFFFGEYEELNEKFNEMLATTQESSENDADREEFDIEKMYPNYTELYNRIVTAEPRFYHLPEYWELRGGFAELPFYSGVYARYMETPLISNTTCYEYLIKALTMYGDTDSQTSGLDEKVLAYSKASLCNRIAEAAYNQLNDIPYEELVAKYSPEEIDFARMHWLKRAVEYEPDNAYHKYVSACESFSLGEWDKAMQEFEETAECSYSRVPRLFPTSYIYNHPRDYFFGSGVFKDISVETRWHFYTYSLVSDPIPDSVLMKDAIVNSRIVARLCMDQKELLMMFNRLHKATCALMRDKDNSLGIVVLAETILKLNSTEAINLSWDLQDDQLEKAILALKGEIDCVDKLLRVNEQSTYDLLIYYPLKGLDISLDESSEEELNEYFENPDLSNVPGFTENEEKILVETTLMSGIKGFLTGKNLYEDQLLPIIERISTFDYENAGAWYEKWLVDQSYMQVDDLEMAKDDSCSSGT